jgi:DNA-binding transcriptional LysR family regulator
VQEFSGVEAIKQCAAAGMGVAVLPAGVAAAEVGDGRLVALPWSGGELRLVTQAARHGGRWLSPAVRAFLDVARKVLAPGGGARVPEPAPSGRLGPASVQAV